MYEEFTDRSAITEHAWVQDHLHQLERGTSAGPGGKNYCELVLKEALCIQTTSKANRLNWDEGYEVPGCWIATIRKLGGGAGRNHAPTSSHVYP